ncbi:hypothetical protein OOJ91_12150 [Micromonospora lupini]|uniref:hypothetical protein n=1 Tax=Micromonospora lupini TaxID=285679 RepID=UPI00224F0BA6|nr:hypothetical protein [Micromonospora lupini]MCX5066630.1 hypothetical protein [Micromonospora lupini]
MGHTIDRFDSDFTPATIARMKRVWRKLEKQLSDPGDVAAEPAPPDLRPALLRDVPVEVQDGWEWWCGTCRRPLPTARWHGLFSYHLLDDYSLFHRVIRRPDNCSAARLLREVRERSTNRAREQEDARTRLGIPNWERHCRNCGRHGEPQHGLRIADGSAEFRATAGEVVVAVELCQVCPHCQATYPGPVLLATTEHRPAEGEWHYRLRTYVGDRKYGHQTVVLESRLTAVRNPAEYVRRKWDRMESQLLRRIADDEAGRREPDLIDSARYAFATVGQVFVAPTDSDLTDPSAWRYVGTTTADGITTP